MNAENSKTEKKECDCCGRLRCSFKAIKQPIVTTEDIVNAVNDYDEYHDEPKEAHDDFKWISEKRLREAFKIKLHDWAVLCEGYDGPRKKSVQAHIEAMMDEFEKFSKELGL